MPRHQQRRFMLGVFENLPGLSFLVLSRTGFDLRLVGWIGTVLAVLVCGAYLWRILRPHPILLGINLFMVAITPAIEMLFLINQTAVARLLIANIDTLVMSSIFATGVVLTMITKTGFLIHEPENTRQMRIQSAILLFVCAAGAVWSQLAGDNSLLSLVLPLSILFGLQQYLNANASDRRFRHDALVATSAPASKLDMSI